MKNAFKQFDRIILMRHNGRYCYIAKTGSTTMNRQDAQWYTSKQADQVIKELSTGDCSLQMIIR